MPIQNGKCDCGAEAVTALFDAFVYEGYHTEDNINCKQELAFASEPSGGQYTYLLSCPFCRQRNARYRRVGTKQVSRQACPKGCP